MILWQCFGLKTGSMHDEAEMSARNPQWEKFTGAIPFPRKGEDIQALIDGQGCCLMKTHEHPDRLDYPDAPAIYILRDGREACVSYWKFLRALGGCPNMTLREVIRGECPFGSWSEHLRSWNVWNRHKTLVLVYQEMIGKTGSMAREATSLLAHFLGKKMVRSFMTGWRDVQKTDPVFFRAGTNETWRDLMTTDDLALFEEIHGETMREFGYMEQVHDYGRSHVASAT